MMAAARMNCRSIDGLPPACVLGAVPLLCAWLWVEKLLCVEASRVRGSCPWPEGASVAAVAIGSSAGDAVRSLELRALLRAAVVGAMDATAVSDSDTEESMGEAWGDPAAGEMMACAAEVAICPAEGRRDLLGARLVSAAA